MTVDEANRDAWTVIVRKAYEWLDQHDTRTLRRIAKLRKKRLT